MNKTVTAAIFEGYGETTKTVAVFEVDLSDAAQRITFGAQSRAALAAGQTVVTTTDPQWSAMLREEGRRHGKG